MDPVQDPVSRSLTEIERNRPRMAPFVLIAATLHLLVPSSVFLLAHQRPQPRAAQLPTISVRLIQEPRPRTRRPSTPAARPVSTPMPQPTAAPRPTAAPQPTAAPPPRETRDTPQASADAMPDLDSRTTTPAPTPEAAAQEGIGRGGLSLGGGGAAQESGIPSDFQFTYYLQRMLTLIESRWYKPPVASGTSARARFTILTGGKVQGIALEVSSDNSSFDRAVLRALYAANPLPPLPPAYRKPSLTIHLTFTHTQ